jgi:hypothetical protein
MIDSHKHRETKNKTQQQTRKGNTSEKTRYESVSHLLNVLDVIRVLMTNGKPASLIAAALVKLMSNDVKNKHKETIKLLKDLVHFFVPRLPRGAIVEALREGFSDDVEQVEQLFSIKHEEFRMREWEHFR